MPRIPKATWAQLDDRKRPEPDAVEIFMAAMRKLFEDGFPVAAGTAAIGSVKDNGPAWTTSRGVSGARFTSSDQSASFASVTDAPTTGQKIVITDLLISSDTALRLDFAVESATGTIIETVYMAANETKQITPRGKWKLATANKKLQVQASAAGNISITPFYYSEE